jgi:uncharacterized protein YrzB (UPF0473 family)
MADGEEWMDDDHVVLTDEEGREHSFEVVDVIEVEGSEYAILTPDEESEDEEDPGEAMIFRIEHGEGDEEMLVEIEDDDEWERVAEAYDRLADEEDEEDEFMEDEDEDEDEESDELPDEEDDEDPS